MEHLADGGRLSHPNPWGALKGIALPPLNIRFNGPDAASAASQHCSALYLSMPSRRGRRGTLSPMRDYF